MHVVLYDPELLYSVVCLCQFCFIYIFDDVILDVIELLKHIIKTLVHNVVGKSIKKLF